MSIVTEPAGAPMGEQQDIQHRRSRAVRTAWLMAAIAGLIFVAFILSGVLGK